MVHVFNRQGEQIDEIALNSRGRVIIDWEYEGEHDECGIEPRGEEGVLPRHHPTDRAEVRHHDPEGALDRAEHGGDRRAAQG